MKKWLIILVILSIGVFLTACGKEEASGDEPVYKIGAIYSSTGHNSPLGEPQSNATQMLVDEINDNGGINGTPLEIVLADDESSQEKATQEMNRLINDENVLAVLGTSGTGESMAMKGIATQNEVPMVAAAASAQLVEPVEDSHWVFKTPQSDVLAVEKVYTYLQSEGITKVATLTDSNAFGETGLEQLEEVQGNYDIEIVAKEVYNTEDTDMSSQLTKIDSSEAEALIVWGTNPGPANIAVNMQVLGMDIPYIGSHGIANQTFIDLAGDAAEGIVIPTGRLLFPDEIPEDDANYEALDSFYTNYTEQFDGEPGNFGSYGHDNLMLVVEALENGATDRESIRDYLENEINDWVGTTGTFNMSPEDHNGLDIDSLVMAEVKEGEWVLLED
ncbi:ABC transporter substrate-binding protein [Oceanobacillus sp. J11TS1]|uniref:ABC transporter substrate-binding protein n=1 Tax=Oceanobacillus sp. J11TS1 TaxID=2807191 RepID=UPI001B1E51A1|nr:ABC transporter substrate-binding protein [Oceanobacillus sp. J11TS1]GIO23637.1 branched-chain amino acid ABC transporter substrate-binding protein [Oceanobacillus sp. J11TS1]